MILHLAFNTSLVFFILAGAIELLLILFRIKNARLRTICRLLPIVKLPFDLIVIGLFGESFLINLNPFSCELFFNDLLKGLFLPGESADIPFSDYIASKMPPYFLKAMVLGITTASVIKLLQKWSEVLHSSQFVKMIRNTSFPCQRPIINEKLKRQLKRRRITILISPAAKVPFAAGWRLIVLPESLIRQLTQSEFEAIIAHEFEHLKWRDPIVKVTCNFVCSLFWWIPMKWWMRRLEADQEKASDSAIYKYNMEPLFLADAFIKAASYIKTNTEKSTAICSFASNRVGFVDRLEYILNFQKMAEGKLKWTLALSFSLIISICIWSC